MSTTVRSPTCWDAQTRAHIQELIDLPGKRCLEVAAGAGSIALWLAEHAAEVLATDIAPQHIPARPRLAVRLHDIVAGEPLGGFDLVHARLLLAHLPQRTDALRQMVAALAPGGMLLTEDFIEGPGTFVSYAPDPVTADALSRYMEAHLEALTAHGNDRAWGHRAPAAFTEAGLTDVRLRIHGGSWHGGDPGCRLLLASLPQLRDGLLAQGLTDDDLALAAEALMDPRVILSGFLTLQTSGRAA